MIGQPKKCILVINVGSSSLKFKLFHTATIQLICTGIIDHIGEPKGLFEIKDLNGQLLKSQKGSFKSAGMAAKKIVKWIQQHNNSYIIEGIGHRLVQGGPKHRQPEIIKSKLINVLHKLAYLAPNHLPEELKIVRMFQSAYPKLVQVACFDTAFHKDMPAYAKFYALPKVYKKNGLIKYGFHGLSYEYILQKLSQTDRSIQNKKIIIAHLGNGASMVAVKNGISIDTTMGISPVGGLVMGTRSGDLDPGVVLYLLKQEKLTPNQIDNVLSKQSGLMALAGKSDIKQLLAEEPNDKRIQEALQLFCYQAKKFIGALATTMGGLDMLVFTGGIGENSAVIRERICADMEFLGIKINKDLNQSMQENITATRSKVLVKVLKTNEELMIAQHTKNMI